MSVAEYCYIATLHVSAIIIYPTYYKPLSQVRDAVTIVYEQQAVVFSNIP